MLPIGKRGYNKHHHANPHSFFILRGQIYHMSMMQEGTYAHRAALWKNGLIFMFLVHRIMTKIYEVIFTTVFLFELVVLLIRRT